MIQTPYVLPRRFVFSEAAPWAFVGLLSTLGVLLIYSGVAAALTWFPRIPVVRTFLGLAACVVLGLVIGVVQSECFKKGRLTDPREAFRLAAVFLILGAALHVWAFDHGPARLHYGSLKAIGLVTVVLIGSAACWVSFIDEIFCESCTRWGTRQRTYLRMPGSDPLVFLQGLDSGQRRGLSDAEEDKGSEIPYSFLDVWSCPCGVTSAVKGYSVPKADRKDEVLKLSGISSDLLSKLRAIREGEDARFTHEFAEVAQELDAELEDTSLYTESRAMKAGVAYYLTLVVGLFFGLLLALGLVVIGASFWESLRHKLAGMPEPGFTERVKDFVFTTLFIVPALYYGGLMTRLGLRINSGEARIVLTHEAIQLSLSGAAGLRVILPRESVKDIALADYKTRAARRLLKRDDRVRTIVLGTMDSPRGMRNERGVRVELTDGEVIHIALGDPEAFVAAFSEPNRAKRRSRH